jgi:hypothetical protein
VELEAEIDRLYGVPLDEFVAERDTLAKQLTRAGDREAAARVKGLRKPTVGAWALNQAIRRRRPETEALIATADRLQEAQDALLSGGDPSELREATRAERTLTAALAECAEAIASESGKSGPALRDRVRATLHATAIDPEARAELETGRFTREREAVGLGAFGGTPSTTGGAPTRAPARKPSGAKPRRAGAKPARPPKGPKQGESAPDRAAAREAAEREERVTEAEAELAHARAAHEAAAADHASAVGALEQARETLREAEVAERDARRVMREHEREVARRERHVERMRPKR